MINRSLSFAFLLAGIAAVQAFAGQAAVPANDAESRYLAYHQGVQAAQSCRDVVLSTEQHTTIEAVIERRVNGQIGPGRRLGLIEAAKDGMRATIAENGCDADDVKSALARFDELTKTE